ncbi:site-2 protease family protein, partial [Streptococcus pyogenes]
MQGMIAFIFIFGVIVVVHEFGHFYFAKKAGILVRE